MLPSASPWVVLKFGGTSVASAARWATIADIARARLAEGLRPLVVCSALSKVTDLLGEALTAALDGAHDPVLDRVDALHAALAAELGVEALHRGTLDEVRRILLGASLTREVTPRQRARVLASGELMSTRLGAAWLARVLAPDRASGGTSGGTPGGTYGRASERASDHASEAPAAGFLDARDCLRVLDRAEPEATRFLSATCATDADPALQATLAARPEAVLVTQGFIARTARGDTVLLGRGGSDTSASLFAAALTAARCEIWTDVPGMFTANPREVPQARLLRHLDYDEAQEIASTGAKVLHPRCIDPVRRHGIPLWIRSTPQPDVPGTVIEALPGTGPRVKALSARTGQVLLSIDTLRMWQQVGFLADVFAVFRTHGVSVDLVSTSESNVTVSIDPAANALGPDAIDALVADLGRLAGNRADGPAAQGGPATAPEGPAARAIGPCASVSLVGSGIRTLLHRLGPALALFQEERIHLVSQAASDLNLTFVVDEEQAPRLVRELHALLFEAAEADSTFGPSWREVVDGPAAPAARDRWWVRRRDELLALPTPAYVYDGPSVDAAAAALRDLRSVDRVFYALKANPHPGLLRRIADAGLGFECVSPGELERALSLVVPDRVLFTPNFAPRAEYAAGLDAGVHVTLDNVHPLAAWPELFAGRAILLRLDPGAGRGHHDHVKTGGKRSKFGIAHAELDRVASLCQQHGVRVVGLHAHVGSGILDASSWSDVALFLARAAERFPEVDRIDLGGGLGVPEKPDQSPLDLAALDAALARIRAAHPRFALWLEPGRFLVAEAGVLLARVTQLKKKDDVTFVGVDTGMNSLIRPALYGAWHEIVNLTRLGAPLTQTVHVVGPICETGDTLGHARRLPDTQEGDVLLIATAGAYGRAMSSCYNLREPAGEVLLG
ncbi:MAG: bifunctional aspartate kinase/diaminopimelate decarboxylase [Pseudomonadota bacterium]|nr:bifunctional aspartate kinase/diaminopimelate decarboxylase [Pseudomonadota bacterium]